jgi:hypothetical protein
MNELQKTVELFPNKGWDWTQLSRNPEITPEFVEKHPEMPWVWGEYGLSMNLSITLDFIEKHIHGPWDWGCNCCFNSK